MRKKTFRSLWENISMFLGISWLKGRQLSSPYSLATALLRKTKKTTSTNKTDKPSKMIGLPGDGDVGWGTGCAAGVACTTPPGTTPGAYVGMGAS